MKSALITGITGQDGNHLTEFLLKKDYKIYGLVNGQKNFNLDAFKSRFPSIELIGGDLTDFSSLCDVVNISQPDEIYNLGAISYVGMSFSQPELTANVTGLGTLRVLEAVRKANLETKTKIYQASSSEMFGKVQQTPQNENTPFYPRSPYGVAKTFAHYTCINYREAYNMHVSSGILFNHEGEHRGKEFVTRKISSNIAKIKLGKQKKFSLGSLDPKRDWGYAGDYVEAMWMMVQNKDPDTFVIATGETHTVREFVAEALKVAGLQGEVEQYIDMDKSMIRPSEVDLLVGDATKAKEKLGWIPRVNFSELVQIMVENDLRLESQN